MSQKVKIFKCPLKMLSLNIFVRVCVKVDIWCAKENVKHTQTIQKKTVQVQLDTEGKKY